MANEKFDWNKLRSAKAALMKRAAELKQAFIQMPGGQKEAQDPGAGAPPPGMDPEMMGGDPAAMGMPPPGVDPAAMGGMPPPGMDPAAMGGMPMDPAAMGAMPPMGVDPATAGMLGGMPPDAGAGAAMAGAGGAGTPEPTITITLSQLWDIVTKVLGLAKKIGANGQGITPEAAPAQPAGQDAIKAAVIEALGDMGLNR